ALSTCPFGNIMRDGLRRHCEDGSTMRIETAPVWEWCTDTTWRRSTQQNPARATFRFRSRGHFGWQSSTTFRRNLIMRLLRFFSVDGTVHLGLRQGDKVIDLGVREPLEPISTEVIAAAPVLPLS